MHSRVHVYESSWQLCYNFALPLWGETLGKRSPNQKAQLIEAKQHPMAAPTLYFPLAMSQSQLSLELLKNALKKLTPAISESRRVKVASVVAARSKSVSLLLENVHNEANVNAVLRSMDALGCMDLHRLTTTTPTPQTDNRKHRFSPRTDSGARAWISIHQWYNTRDCISYLKGKHGYLLASTCPTAQTSITDVDFSQKLLIAFGNEGDGISEELAELTDVKFSLPMCGFVQSFNISVSVALTLYHAYLHRTRSQATGGDLSEREQLEWTYRYYMKHYTRCIADPNYEVQKSPKGFEELHHILTNTL